MAGPCISWVVLVQVEGILGDYCVSNGGQVDSIGVSMSTVYKHTLILSMVDSLPVLLWPVMLIDSVSLKYFSCSSFLKFDFK
jgi:hypothetical protein